MQAEVFNVCEIMMMESKKNSLPLNINEKVENLTSKF